MKKGHDLLGKVIKYQKVNPQWRVPREILFKIIKLTRPRDSVRMSDIDPDAIPAMLQKLSDEKRALDLAEQQQKADLPPKKKKKKKPKVVLPKREKHVRAEAILKKIYYDVRNPASYSAPYTLYKAAKKINKNIRIRDVNDWLSSQNAYTLYRPVKSVFKRRKVIVRGLHHQHQADLVDFQPLARENDGKAFLLTILDCFSRRAVAVPIKSKSATSVLEGFKRAYKLMPMPKKIQTDRGGEFYNELVSRFFRENNIAHFSTDQELKAQMVERFNRTLRDLIQKDMVARRSLRYIDRLPDFLFRYNASPHGGLKGNRPIDVTKNTEQKFYSLQYKDYLEQKKPTHKYKIHDTVRVAMPKKGKMKMDRTFKKDLYKIVDAIDSIPPMYKVKKLSNNELVQGSYYEPQLMRVNVDEWTIDEKMSEDAIYNRQPAVRSKYYGATSESDKKRQKRKKPAVKGKAKK